MENGKWKMENEWQVDELGIGNGEWGIGNEWQTIRRCDPVWSPAKSPPLQGRRLPRQLLCNTMFFFVCNVVYRRCVQVLHCVQYDTFTLRCHPERSEGPVRIEYDQHQVNAVTK